MCSGSVHSLKFFYGSASHIFKRLNQKTPASYLFVSFIPTVDNAVVNTPSSCPIYFCKSLIFHK